MEMYWQVTVLILSLLMPLWGVISEVTEQTLSATCGGSVLFHVNISKNIEINSIFWSSNATGKKRMLAIAKPGRLQVIDYRFKSRVTSQQLGFSLTLSDLKEEDCGTYEAVIYTDVDTRHMYFNLQVYAKNKSHRSQWTRMNFLGTVSLGFLVSYIATKT
ncbi:T-lymphocyte surface antigen Ly-9-like [Mixophyes fleayi]|uniref:T-lymphocyte surface antigen Ly-9-like n=1 Tax=Mixophyes fleayi TaxID=3061075 RepID=UPI003F4DE202